MDGPSKGRAWFKFLFWTVVSVAIFTYASHTYTSGQMIRWYYYTAATDGYAINANTFMGATKENPAVLQIGELSRISGLQAVPVKKGQRLPDNTNGILSTEEIRSGKRVALEGETIKVMVPWQIMEQKGFKFKDTFKHKGITTYPWAGVWNVALVAGAGLALGLMAEGFTDVVGMKLSKIDHHGGH